MSFSNKLYTSRSIILELLRDRGYDTTKYDNFTSEEIDIMFKTMSTKSKEISTLDIKLNDENDKNLLVKYVLSPKIRVSNIIGLTETFIEENLEEGDTFIMIIRDKLTTDESLEEYFKKIYETKNIFCQYFWINMLTFNLTQHEMVPKHEILNEDEKTELIKKLQINDILKLPFIKQTEPVAKYYGMKEGDICKITRKSETAGNYVSYRLCQN